MLIDISIEIALEIPFLDFCNTNIEFMELKKLIKRSYTAGEILLTIGWVEFINQRESAKTALNKNSKTFVIYIVILEILTAMSIYFLKTFQGQKLNKLILTAL